MGSQIKSIYVKPETGEIVYSQDAIRLVAQKLRLGLTTDSADNKQWALREIAKHLSLYIFDLVDIDEGTPP